MKWLAVAISSVAVLMVAAPAHAVTAYTWSVDGSVRNAGLPAGLAPGIELGPNVSSAKDGARIEIAGSGRLVPGERWIDGAGDYRIVDRSGKVLASGRFKPTGLTSFRDTGTEPEGSPVEQLRAGAFIAPIAMQGLGTAQLDFECGQHSRSGEIEGVRIKIRGRNFDRIESGSTTLERD